MPLLSAQEAVDSRTFETFPVVSGSDWEGTSQSIEIGIMATFTPSSSSFVDAVFFPGLNQRVQIFGG